MTLNVNIVAGTKESNRRVLGVLPENAEGNARRGRCVWVNDDVGLVKV